MKTTAYLGPPGTGKTHTLINIVKDALQQGTPPERIGFVSFSKKATEEARTRASRELNSTTRRWCTSGHYTRMAFRQLDMKIDQVLRSSDYRRLEMELGLPFTSTQSMNINDGEFFVLVARVICTCRYTTWLVSERYLPNNNSMSRQTTGHYNTMRCNTSSVPTRNTNKSLKRLTLLI